MSSDSSAADGQAHPPVGAGELLKRAGRTSSADAHAPDTTAGEGSSEALSNDHKTPTEPPPSEPSPDDMPAGRHALPDQPPPATDERPGPPHTISIDAIANDSAFNEHAGSLNKFKQGDLLAAVPMSWTAPGAIDPLTGLESSEADTGPILYDAPEDGPVIICSQTCDLGAGPPGDKHPFLHVAPVIHESAIGSSSRRSLAAEGKIGYLIQVLPPDPATRARLGIDIAPGPESVRQASARGDRWYADLRILMPVSKALLLKATPITGFVTEAEHLHFAETLAQKFRRPALNEQLSENLPRFVKEFIQNTGKGKQCIAKVEQVRVHVLDGDRLNPTRAHLFVLTSGVELTEDEQDQWAPLSSKLTEAFADADIAFASLIHADVHKLAAVIYRDGVPIPCDLFGPVRWW